MSRRAKPVEDARRDGNPGHRPLRDPIVPGGRNLPQPPEYLRPAMRRVFEDVRGDLDEAGVIAHIDGQALTRYAIAQGLAIEIVESFGDESLAEIVAAETRPRPGAQPAHHDAPVAPDRGAAHGADPRRQPVRPGIARDQGDRVEALAIEDEIGARAALARAPRQVGRLDRPGRDRGAGEAPAGCRSLTVPSRSGPSLASLG